ncbi:MAG: tRNA pseudouridine(38-40) synthase TruA [Verrucomicrobiales bacterium]|nr:tRNA pseudouridine(38-40) synthase TruA [Verrucomicrobiales bacterium]
MRVALTIAYDGTPYSGWQSQPDNNAVQDHIEAAFKTITGTPVRLHASGRTDAGVHALAQVAHFDPPEMSNLDPNAWQRALNSNLPPQIRVTATRETPAGFHARYSATAKTYTYRIVHAPVLPPLEHHRAWHLHSELDTALLAKALARFQGTHDFAAFAASRNDGKPRTADYARRTISNASLETGNAPLLTLSFTGNGFLYKMVRLLTGAATHVARGRAPLSWLQDLIDNPAGKRCPHCAPADGLYLEKVHYPAASKAS